MNTHDLIYDLAETANNAVLACKFHHTYKKKDLISWIKQHNDKEETITHTFELNLIGKEVLDGDLAELFSSFYIEIVRDLSPREPSFNEGGPARSLNRSFFGVKKEKIDSIFDLLVKHVSNFVAGEEIVFIREDFWEKYSFVITYTAQQMFIGLALPNYLKRLMEHLIAFSYILKNQIYLAFYKSTVLAALQCFQEEPKKLRISKQPSSLSLKTVEGHEQCIDQNSTASGSPRNFAALSSSSENFDLEELSQKLNAKNTSVNGRVFSHQDSTEEAKISISDDSYFKSHRNSPMPNFYVIETPAETYYDFYQGFQIGNLDIYFDPTDNLTLEHEDNTGVFKEVTERVNYYDEDEQEILQANQEEAQVFERNDEQYDEGVCNDPNCTQCPPKNLYCPPPQNQMMMNFPPQQFSPQPFMNPGQFSPGFYPQQPIDNIQSNYGPGPQMMYMPNGNAEPIIMNDSAYEPRLYPQDNFNNENYGDYSGESYQSQNYGSYYNNGYENQFQGEGKPYYGKDRSRYEGKPKLPPRFQRRKEGGYRN